MVVVATRAVRAPGAPARGPLPAVSGLACTLALLGHVAGGGRPPASCVLVAATLLVAFATTWAAVHLGARARGSWSTLAALGAGQTVMEALLSAPADHSPSAPLTASAVHAAAAFGLGTVLLGGERVVDDLLAVLDRVLPRWWRMHGVGVPARLRPLLPATPSPARRSRARLPRGLRGPPAVA